MKRAIRIAKILQAKDRPVVKFGEPFKTLIATILSQRARDENTAKVSKLLFSKYSTAEEINNTSLRDIRGLVKSSGFYNQKAKRIKQVSKIIHKDYHDKVPDDIDELIKLPGVGRKTAGCVMVYGFGKPAMPVDIHLHRIPNRMGLVKTRNPEETEEELKKIYPRRMWVKINHTFVRFGQNICKSKPLCFKCPVEKLCEYDKKVFK